MSILLLSGTGGGLPVTDNFADTDGTLLASHVSDSGHAWLVHPSATNSGQIASNRARAKTPTLMAYVADAPAQKDVVIEATIRNVGGTGTKRMGVLARVHPTVNTWYFARYDTSTGAWELLQTVAGTSVFLGSYVTALTAGQDYQLRLEVTDAAKVLYVDGVERLRSTDNTITAAGAIGIRGQQPTDSNSSGIHLDALHAEVFVAGPAAIVKTGLAKWGVSGPTGATFTKSGTAAFGSSGTEIKLGRGAAVLSASGVRVYTATGGIVKSGRAEIGGRGHYTAGDPGGGTIVKSGIARSARTVSSVNQMLYVKQGRAVTARSVIPGGTQIATTYTKTGIAKMEATIFRSSLGGAPPVATKRGQMMIRVLDTDGVPVPSAAALVRDRDSDASATIYIAETGLLTAGNPAVSDARGVMAVWVDEGAYEAVVSATGLLTYVQAFDAVTGRLRTREQNVIASSAVTNAKLATSAVTLSKLASSAVSSTKLVASVITTGKLANTSIGTQIASQAVTKAKLEPLVGGSGEHGIVMTADPRAVSEFLTQVAAGAGSPQSKSPTTVGQIAVAFGTPWTNPQNAILGSVAFSSWDNLTTSNTYFLRFQNFGFTIPAAAVINGIVVGVSGTNSGVSTEINRIYLLKGGTQIGNLNIPSLPSSAVTAATVGNATYLWGTSWTPADINSGAFGFDYVAGAGNAGSASVGSPAIGVYFTLQPTRTVYQRVRGSGTISGVIVQVGVAAGSISVGVYDQAGSGRSARPNTRQSSTGAIPCPPVGTALVAIPPVNMTDGASWFAVSVNNSATQLLGQNLASGLLTQGMAYQEEVHPCPAGAGTLANGDHIYSVVGG